MRIRPLNGAPKKLCAICTEKNIQQSETFCKECEDQWKDHLEEPWCLALVELTKDEFNQRMRDHGRVVSLERGGRH